MYYQSPNCHSALQIRIFATHGGNSVLHKVEFHFFLMTPTPKLRQHAFGVFVDREDALWFSSVVSLSIKFVLALVPSGVFSQLMVWFNEVLINNKLVAVPQNSSIKTWGANEYFQLILFSSQTNRSSILIKRQWTLSYWAHGMRCV